MNQHLLSVHWGAAQMDYLNGMTVAKVCAKHGIPRSTFYQRALDEGWRREDVKKQVELREGDTPVPEAPPPPSWKLSEIARARAAEAILAGRMRDSEGWTRLAARLRHMAQQESSWHHTWHGIVERGRAAESVQGPEPCPGADLSLSGCDEKAFSGGLDSPESPEEETIEEMERVANAIRAVAQAKMRAFRADFDQFRQARGQPPLKDDEEDAAFWAEELAFWEGEEGDP